MNFYQLRNSNTFNIDDLNESINWLDPDDPDDEEELSALLEAFKADAGDAEEFIAVSYFRDYAQELAEDTGAIPDDYAWPASCIDWEQAARELAMDYGIVTLDGVDFYCR